MEVLKKSRVDLTRMLEQTVFEFLPMCHEKDLSCKLELQDPVMINCDAEKLQRVFDNILRNAVAYGEADRGASRRNHHGIKRR